MAKTRDRREGAYLIKRVEVLPENGSGTYLYTVLEEDFSKLYRWKKKGEYEEIPLFDDNNVITPIDYGQIEYEDRTTPIPESLILDKINSIVTTISSKEVILAKVNVKELNFTDSVKSIKFDDIVEYRYLINPGKGVYGVGNTLLTLDDISFVSKNQANSSIELRVTVENATPENVGVKLIDKVDSLFPVLYIRPNQSLYVTTFYVVNGVLHKHTKLFKHSDLEVGSTGNIIPNLTYPADYIDISNDIMSIEERLGTIFLGDIGAQTVSEAFNVLDPNQFAEQGYFVEATQNDNNKVWFFNGAEGTYGLNGDQAVEEDFELLSNVDNVVLDEDITVYDFTDPLFFGDINDYIGNGDNYPLKSGDIIIVGEGTYEKPIRKYVYISGDRQNLANYQFIEEEQDNISRTIIVESTDLSGIGTIEEQITEYINSLNYVKDPGEGDTFVKLVETINNTFNGMVTIT